MPRAGGDRRDAGPGETLGEYLARVTAHDAEADKHAGSLLIRIAELKAALTPAEA